LGKNKNPPQTGGL